MSYVVEYLCVQTNILKLRDYYNFLKTCALCFFIYGYDDDDYYRNYFGSYPPADINLVFRRYYTDIVYK